MPRAVREALERFAAEHPGLLIEHKGESAAVHFRQAPELAERVQRWAEHIVAELGEDFLLQPGKMVVELRPAGSDKGAAIAALMNLPPFAGRRPLFIGDDVTDESGFKLVNALNGWSIRVGREATATAANFCLHNVDAVRDWLDTLATQPSTGLDMNTLELAVIGNCQIGALLDDRARIVWACLPRLDSDPVFCTLLEPAAPNLGIYEIELVDFERSEQHYIRNTPIVQTTLYDKQGNALRITDFAPRFQLFGRTYHPVMLIRSLTPIHGWPRICVRIRPAGEYGAAAPTLTHGSNHIRFVLPENVLRLTTDISLNSLMEERSFVLTASPPPDPGRGRDHCPSRWTNVARDHFGQTRTYWEAWVRGLAIPFEWQEAVIRAAITLKLCTFDDTGAVIAAMTTSIPEAPDSGRNWDYRYCWLRDSYFTVQALNSLGATKTMEAYLRYMLNVTFDGRRQSAAGLQPDRRGGPDRADGGKSLKRLPRHGTGTRRQPGL